MLTHSKHTTFLDLIHKCKTINSFKQIHANLLTSNTLPHESLLTKTAQFFTKHTTSVHYACNFFKHTTNPTSNSFAYNTLISGYANGISPNTSVSVYKTILRNGFVPDMYTFPVLIKSCTKFFGVFEGDQVHCVVFKMGFACDLYVQNGLVHFYSVCGQCGSACKVFDEMSIRDVVSWTGLISGCVKAGFFNEGVSLFLRMDVEPNDATFVSVLVACGKLLCIDLGKMIHRLIYKAGEMGLVVGNALLDMYAKCECINEAKRVFNELVERDVVSWTSMISGLVLCKRPKEALELFCEMRLSNVAPDKMILTSVLSACASLGALDYGRWVHEYIDRKGIRWDVHIGTAMVDMYAKCGSIDMALQTFHGMSIKNVFTWNAMLGGLAMHGHGHDALKYFDKMIKVGTNPNEVTFLAILTACCHSGLVDEGRAHFNHMISQQHNVSPRLEHYGCMIDLLCKAELLNEAQQLIRAMPMPPDVLIWGSLLSACKSSENFELSRDILDRLLEAQDSGVFVLLSNIYAANKRWDDVKRIRRLMKKKGVRKEPGSSIVEVDGKAHEFLVGDISHPQYQDIHMLLDILASDASFEGNGWQLIDELSNKLWQS